MDSIEAFESEAELFYKDTGFLAPGKSEAAGHIGQTDFEREEVRSLIKRAWDKGRARGESALAAKEAEFQARLGPWVEGMKRAVGTCFTDYAYKEFLTDPNHFAQKLLSSPDALTAQSRST